ncbi:MAG: UvrD-helicase domain-containing protein [bacterium]
MDIYNSISHLNPKQKEAVLYTEGPLLILAGAGSGKTRVITMRVAYLLAKGILPEQVLAVTFTNKSAKEMQERVKKIVKLPRGKKKPIISTFHSLCLTILRNEIECLGYRKDFTIYDTSEQLSLLRNLMTEIKVHDKSFKVENIMERISKIKSSSILASKPDKKQGSSEEEIEEVAHSLWNKYQKTLITFNAVDFDDLLLLTVDLFTKHPYILQRYQERFKYIMVDEYQDTNLVQYNLIRLLAGKNMNLCVVGDDDQSIYGWRGANIYNILEFEKDFPNTKVVRLEQNYRSFGHILKAANGVIKNNKKRMKKTLWTQKELGPKVKLVKALNEEEEAQWIADRISLIKYEQNIHYEDVAIIYRANTLSLPFEEAFRREKIPYHVVGGTSYFERREIKDIIAYLKIIANPNDELSLLRITNIPKRGLGLTTLEKFSGFARDNEIPLLEALKRGGEIKDIKEKVAQSALKFASLIDCYREKLKDSKDMSAIVKNLIQEINYRDFIGELYKTPDVIHRRIENVNNFVESLGRYEGGENPTLQGFLEEMALVNIEEKTDNNFGVTLISFHSSKGLEFPIVFIVAVEDNILPHKKSATSPEEIEEERRLFYVGITRAQRELYLLYTEHRIKYGKKQPSAPSPFLEEIPPEVIENESDKVEAKDPEESKKKARAFFDNIQEMLK